MKRVWTGVVVIGLSCVGLSGCYVVSPYPPPAYAYPPPTPGPPPVRGAGPPPQGGPAMAPPPPPASPSQAPAAPGAPGGSARNCQTVMVEGHAETRVTPDGQRETVWVPTHARQLCQ
jgi:hypothetical protein